MLCTIGYYITTEPHFQAQIHIVHIVPKRLKKEEKKLSRIMSEGVTFELRLRVVYFMPSRLSHKTCWLHQQTIA